MATTIIAPTTAQATEDIVSAASGSITIQVDTPNGAPANRRNVVSVSAVSAQGPTLVDYISAYGVCKVYTLWGVGDYRITKFETDVAVGVSIHEAVA